MLTGDSRQGIRSGRFPQIPENADFNANCKPLPEGRGDKINDQMYKVQCSMNETVLHVRSLNIEPCTLNIHPLMLPELLIGIHSQHVATFVLGMTLMPADVF